MVNVSKSSAGNTTTWISELDKARDALSYIDSTSRDDWLLIGAALKNALGQEAFDLWDSWSAKADSYNAKTTKYTWDRFKPGKAGLGTVFHLAKQVGFDPSGRIGHESLSNEAKQAQAELRAQRALEEAAKLAQQQERYAKVATLSLQLWQDTLPAANDHPYLLGKGIDPTNLHEIDQAKLASLIGYSPKANDEPLAGRILLAGVGAKGLLSTIEMIDEAGRKSALAGGRKSQSYWVANDVFNGSPEAIYIAEGIATTRSIHHSYQALQETISLPNALIVAALSSSNMVSVAQSLRAQFPEVLIVIASDIGNGERDAIKAALLVDGLVAKPAFEQTPSNWPKLSITNPTDFNDLHQLSGSRSVVLNLLAAQTPLSLGFALQEGRVVAIEEPAFAVSPVSSAPVQENLPVNELEATPLVRDNSPDTLLEPITIRGFDDPNRAAFEVQIAQAVSDDPKRFIDRYKQDRRSHAGLYVNSDLFKETFEQYAQSPESRSFYNLPAHNSAAVLAAALFRENLATARAQITEGGARDRVLLVTGTPGAGKSTFITSAIEGNFDIATVFEGQLADVAATKIKLDQILDKGLRPEIYAVHAKAEHALDNALNRFEQVGRGASIDLIANLLSRLPQSLAEVHQTYGDQVKLITIDRRDPKEVLIAPGWDYLPTLSSEGTYEHIQERLSTYLEKRYQSGSISLASYEQARGRAPTRPSIGIRQTRGSRIEPDEHGPRVSQDDAKRQLLDPGATPTFGAGNSTLALPALAPVSSEDLRQHGQALQALDFPSHNLFNTQRVFAFHEASDEPIEIFDLDVLNRYTYDQLLTLPIDFNPSISPKVQSANTANLITDFGQKIGGARKDLWTGYLDKLKQSELLAARDVPLSQYWPEPNYQKLITAGFDRQAVAYLRVLREAIPNKPKSSYKLSSWNSKVQISKSIASQISEAMRDPSLLAGITAQFSNVPQISDQVLLYQIAGHAQSLARFQIRHASYSMIDGVHYNPPKSLWSIEEKSSQRSWPKSLLVADTKEALLAQFSAQHVQLLGGAKNRDASDKRAFILYRKRAQGAYGNVYIAKKIGGQLGSRYIDLAGPFEDAKSAREYRASHSVELEQTLAKLKAVPSVRAQGNEPRLGIDYRQGQNITPEQFSEVFAFRGVEFGNWVEQSRRQIDLNEAYDALMDLSRALALPPAALSLGGQLGLAFGARGRGGVDPAKAHYEPGHVVINLTKEKGAGSLAHEWWHGLDHYLARSAGEHSPEFVTENPQDAALRAPLQSAFIALMDSIQSTELPARSAKMDALRTVAYWSTPVEMSARSFEAFIGDRLGHLGIRNDYLVNYLAPGQFEEADLARYPYPLPNEVVAINPAFDHVFAAVQTRQTDAGIAMYRQSSSEQNLSGNGLSIEAATMRVQELLAPYPHIDIPIEVVEDPRAAGLTDPGFKVAGQAQADRIYLFRSGITDLLDLEKTLWHELLHTGLGRLLNPQQYVERLTALYDADPWIAHRANQWTASIDGQSVFKKHPNDAAYVKARAVDEALAQLAQVMQSTPVGYRLPSSIESAVTQVRTWVANLADTLGFPNAAKSWRESRASQAAKDLVVKAFGKLGAGDGLAHPISNDQYPQRAKRADLTHLSGQANAPVGTLLSPISPSSPASPIANTPVSLSLQGNLMAKIAKTHKPPEVDLIPFNYVLPTLSPGKRPMWAPEVTPPYLIAAGKEYFGSKREFIVPYHDGGPYKGQIYQFEDKYLFQQLGDDQFTLHLASDLSSKSPIIRERLGQSFTGIYLSIKYEGNDGIVTPYDPFKDQFIYAAQLVDKVATDRDYSQRNRNMFKSMWRITLEDVYRARMGFPKAVAMVGEQIKPPGVLDPFYEDRKEYYKQLKIEDEIKAIKRYQTKLAKAAKADKASDQSQAPQGAASVHDQARPVEPGLTDFGGGSSAGPNPNPNPNPAPSLNTNLSPTPKGIADPTPGPIRSPKR